MKIWSEVVANVSIAAQTCLDEKELLGLPAHHVTRCAVVTSEVILRAGGDLRDRTQLVKFDAPQEPVATQPSAPKYLHSIICHGCYVLAVHYSGNTLSSVDIFFTPLCGAESL